MSRIKDFIHAVKMDGSTVQNYRLIRENRRLMGIEREVREEFEGERR